MNRVVQRQNAEELGISKSGPAKRLDEKFFVILPAELIIINHGK
jgi:hypothetical protein